MPEGVQHLSISLSVDQVEFPEAEMELELFEDGKSIKRTRGALAVHRSLKLTNSRILS